VCASFPDAEVLSPFTLPVANLWQNAGLVFAGLAAGGWAQVFGVSIDVPRLYWHKWIGITEERLTSPNRKKLL